MSLVLLDIVVGAVRRPRGVLRQVEETLASGDLLVLFCGGEKNEWNSTTLNDVR